MAVISTGTDTRTIELLTPDTDYVIFVAGMDYECNHTEGYASEEFRTEAVAYNNMTFTITPDISGISGNVTVVPSDMEQQYFTAVLKTSQIASYEGTLKEELQNMFFEQIDFYTSFGMTTQEVLDNLCTSGEEVIELTGQLDANTEYCAFAVSVSESGVLNSELTEKNFTTGTPGASDNIISLTVMQIMETSAIWSTQTSNMDPYTVVVAPASDFSGMDESEIPDYITSSGKYSITVYNGGTSGELKNLTEGTDYFAVAFGIDGMYPTTDAVVYPFTTSSSASGYARLTITVDDISGSTVYYTVTGEPASAAYFHGLIYADYDSEQVHELVQSYADATLGWGLMVALTMDSGTTSTSRQFIYTPDGSNYYLQSGDNVKVFAFGVNQADLSYDQNVTFSESFTIE